MTVADPSTATPAPDATEALTPSQRLALSRERLRRAMTSDGSGRGRKRSARADDHGDAPNDAGSSGGAFSTFVRLATHWWESHPLREAAHIATHVAAPAADALLGPVARRHPWRLVLVAAGVGGAIVWARPWRWLPQAALSSVLVSTIWPRGGLSRWLASGGLISLLTSSELRHWLTTVLQENAPGSEADGEADVAPTGTPPPSDLNGLGGDGSDGPADSRSSFSAAS